ncbi:hypothetical protein [uncultured Pseudokineococcus sp.]|uniref:hypothetical protein n=1 Tax=uncultured Pseudokineococcus sp. TaxID=1642928 RepID=UPI002611B4D3|nr:hypothetical protein [uncultured Pseudokineococcus sp.]
MPAARAPRAATLELAEVPRGPGSPAVEDRAHYLPWLRGPRHQFEFVVDGTHLRDLLSAVDVPDDTDGLGDPFDLVSVADPTWPAPAATGLRRLACVQARVDADWPLASGRLPLYVCPMCADLACGAVTVYVDHTQPGQVTWPALRHENGYSPDDELDLSAAGPFVFDADDYRATLLAPVAHLEALAADERAAENTRRRTQPRRRPLGLLQRLMWPRRRADQETR